MQQYLPEWYREILDYQELCLTESEEMEALAQAIHAISDNLFFQTLDAKAVEQWERVFGITADPAVETLSFRRARLLNRISIRPPFTLGFLYQKLDELIGKGQWAVTVNYANYTLYIESSARNQNYATEVAYTVGKMKPAHIVYYNTPYTASGMTLNESIALAKNKFNYKLGGWGLGQSPFVSLEDMGVIKTENTPSIQEKLLESTAEFVSGDIAKARINGTVMISTLIKTVKNSTATVKYTVDPSDTTEIAKVELLDSANNVLTKSVVYVPVTDPVIMTHKIPIKEGDVENA